MAKVLKIKDVNSDVEKRMKEFEKIRANLKTQIAKDSGVKKDSKGLLKSISDFFADSPKNDLKAIEKK
ncbi:hypothetical protein [Flavobacterium hercynium]|uniref:Uncharacterized protein n=1 Tax=Flavobacterium hercynium TaxID=387094 RepID=A0A226HL37_9FLAO|nr:hypothetical protein [Flavobacterium hercynium]OXA94997.1 hypothetical protein B0A66_04565 [Flavobacterium hercynium]SMP09821.1 hypothetical protein SAMN06265346_102344 [Flavobacterium hercynium]